MHQPRHTARGTCDSDAPARTTRSGPKKYSYSIKREIFGADLKHSFHQQLGSLWRQSVARKSTGVDEFPVYYYYQSDLSILWFPASHHHQEHNGVKLFLKSSYFKVTSSRPVDYSILETFGQRSQYISIKFPLHKHSESAWVCY